MNALMSLAEMEAIIKGASPEQKAAMRAKLGERNTRVWMPQPGPQSDAFYSPAEELLYGGAAGGGKTDLIIGLATTAHYDSAIFRRMSNDLDSLWDRLGGVAGPLVVANDGQKKVMKTSDGRSIKGAHLDAPGSEKSHQGRARDFYGFDEGAQLDEYKVMFVTQWLRSTREGQRKRVVIGTNPPIPEYINGQMQDSGTGEWLKRWFAPWLDPLFNDPAKDGELRWCYMRSVGDRWETVWVAGPGRYETETGLKRADDDEDPMLSVAKSRTFIRSLRKDNVFLDGSGYDEKLASSPEPLRSLLMKGDFSVKGEDHPMQVIPTNWVLQANERWKAREHEMRKMRMLVVSADIAQGGADTTVVATLLDDNIFEKPKAQPGRSTPTGFEVVQFILSQRRDGAYVVLDGGGAWGGSTRDLLLSHHHIRAGMCVPSAKSTSWTKDMVYKFGNVRAEMWWLFREALDPKSGEDICLPPDHRLTAQLTAPMHRYRGNTIFIEEKDELRKRLGSSTDEADAVLQAWHFRNIAHAMRRIEAERHPKGGIRSLKDARDMHHAVELDNPLSRW